MPKTAQSRDSDTVASPVTVTPLACLRLGRKVSFITARTVDTPPNFTTTGNYDFTSVLFFFFLIHSFSATSLIRVMGAAGVCPSSRHGNAGYTTDRKTKV